MDYNFDQFYGFELPNKFSNQQQIHISALKSKFS